MTVKRTDELQPGDRVVHDGGRIVRTVDHVLPSGYLNRRHEPILNVYYTEPSEPGVWSGGNSGCVSSQWTVLAQCSWNAGGDPGQPGCDEDVSEVGDLCAVHEAAYRSLVEVAP